MVHQFVHYTALPKITVQPEDITIAEGSNIMLICKATGDGRLNYQWKNEFGTLPRNFISNGGQTLTVHNVTVESSGEYYCEVDNGGEKVVSRRAQVTVKS